MVEVKNIWRRWRGGALNHGKGTTNDIDAVQTADGKWTWVKKGTTSANIQARPLNEWSSDNIIQRVAKGDFGNAHETYSISKMSEIITRYTLRDVPYDKGEFGTYNEMDIVQYANGKWAYVDTGIQNVIEGPYDVSEWGHGNLIIQFIQGMWEKHAKAEASGPHQAPPIARPKAPPVASLPPGFPKMTDGTCYFHGRDPCAHFSHQ